MVTHDLRFGNSRSLFEGEEPEDGCSVLQLPMDERR